MIEERSILLVNGKVITPFMTVEPGFVEFRGRQIQRVAHMKDFPQDISAQVIDVGGYVVAPGCIDIHVHGGGGYDLMDGTPGAILGMAAAHARGGTTALLPSTVTGPLDDTLDAIENVGEAKRLAARGQGPRGARILGIHLEGPYLSPGMCGAQDPKYIKPARREEYSRILEKDREIVRVTLAPEVEGTPDFARELRRRGVLLSVGHSDATYDDMLAALAAGYTHITHLYSAMSTVRRINAFRVAGVLEAAFLHDEFTVELIADGRHLPASLLKLAYKIKGPGRIALITDAMRAAGMPEGEYHLGGKGVGQKVIVEDGVAKLPDRSAFAGSVATANRLIKTMVTLAEVPLACAIQMASYTPAVIIGKASRKGSLDPGKDADIVVLDSDFNVKLTVVEGEIVYSDMDGIGAE